MRGGKSWIEVSEQALRRNLQALRGIADAGVGADERTALLAVVKANAYGHGAAICAPVLARAGAEWLGVTDACEGVLVRSAMRDAGIAFERQPRVLVMSGLEREDARVVRAHALTPVIWFREQIDWLRAVGDAGEPTAVHVEVDTGMARQGVKPGKELGEFLRLLKATPELRLDGLMTHFASSEIAGSAKTEQQQQCFVRAVEQVGSAGFAVRWLHAGNTSTLDEARLVPWLRTQANRLGARLLARSGLGLYGYALSLEGAHGELAPGLRPVGSWKTRVIGVRELEQGETVGYNATYAAARPMRAALLPAGYADGLRRELSSTTTQGGGYVILRGQRAPILGRVSMNLTTVDVTEVPEVAVGDEAVLLGEDVSAEVHARLARTISYEILCAMGGRPVLVL